MAVRRPLVVIGGRRQEIPAGDTLPAGIVPGGGGVVINTVTVDFGGLPVLAKRFDVTVLGATVGQKVIATPSIDMPAGFSEDELEDDPIMIAGRVIAADSVRLIVGSTGPIAGQRNINLILG